METKNDWRGWFICLWNIKYEVFQDHRRCGQNTRKWNVHETHAIKTVTSPKNFFWEMVIGIVYRKIVTCMHFTKNRKCFRQKWFLPCEAPKHAVLSISILPNATLVCVIQKKPYMSILYLVFCHAIVIPLPRTRGLATSARVASSLSMAAVLNKSLLRRLIFLSPI